MLQSVSGLTADCGVIVLIGFTTDWGMFYSSRGGWCRITTIDAVRNNEEE